VMWCGVWLSLHKVAWRLTFDVVCLLLLFVAQLPAKGHATPVAQLFCMGWKGLSWPSVGGSAQWGRRRGTSTKKFLWTFSLN